MSSPLDPRDPQSAAGNPNIVNQARSLLTNAGIGVFWVIIVRGILAILFGVILLAAPAAVAIAIAIFIGVWLIVDGVLTIINANTARKTGLSWGFELASGIVYVIAGLLIAIAPLSFAVISGVFILWMLAVGMLVRGIFSFASKSFKGWSKTLGVIDIIFAVVLGIVLFASPGGALAALVWVVAIYTIIFGIFLIIMAFMARSQSRKAQSI